MLKSIGIMVIYVIIAFFQISQLKKEKLKREIWVFTILMIIVSVVTVYKLNNLPLPSPLDLITILLNPFVNNNL